MSYDVSERPEDALDLGPDDRDDQPNDAPALPADEQDDDQEPDGRWGFSTQAGCWHYE
jgi:hypothetical protein